MIASRIAFCLALPFCAAAELFNLEHAGRLATLTNPQISPDGKSVVVSVTRADFSNNRFETKLVRVDVATKTQTILTTRRATQYQFSPDGRSLAYLSPVDGRNQIHILPMEGGQGMQVSRSKTGVMHFTWRPDGRAFAYTASEESVKPAEDEKFNRSFEADIGYLQTALPLSTHLWLVSLGGGDDKRLTSGEWSLWRPLHWSPDGKRIVFSYYTGPGNRSGFSATVRALEVQTGVLAALTGREKLDAMVGFSPRGNHFAYTWYRDGNSASVRELWVAPLDGGPGRNLTRALDLHLFPSGWTSDGRSLLFVAAQGTQWGLWVQPLDGAARRLELGQITLSYEVSIARDGSLALIGVEPGRPSELYIKRSLDSPPERLTDFNASVSALDLGKQEPIRWRGPDGLELDGVLTYPPGRQSGRAYPLVVLIHGGPRASSVLGFDVKSQWLASQGWIVFEPNYRGSDNHGSAFTEALRTKGGVQGAGRDIMSGVDLLVGKRIADPNKMAVSGWSYGGLMTAWLLGQYPGRWRAGVAGAAPVDPIQSYALSTLRSDRATSPFTSRERLQANLEESPIASAPKIKAPTLVLGNSGDGVVPITSSYTFYHALRDNGVETKLVVYPIPGHVANDPVHQRDVNRRWAEWIKRYMEPSK